MELWTVAHGTTILPALAIMLMVAAALRIIFKNKSLTIRLIPIQIIACLVVALEIGKQAVSLLNGYDLYHLPFHFCSLFIFALPFMAFYSGKHRQTVYAVVSALCSSVFLLMLIYPNLIYSEGNIRDFFTNFLDFHTVAFHNLILFAFILIVALQLHVPQKEGEPRAVAVFTVCFCVVSASMAHMLKTNFNNFYSCNIPILEDVRIHVQGILGTGLTQLLYVLIVTVLDIAFVQGAYWFYRLCRKITADTCKVKSSLK